MQLKDRFPRHFLDFLSPEVARLGYFEAKLDCSKCAFERYNPSLKCCTFEPFIPNFIVGELDLKAGRNSFELPMGIFPKPVFQIEFKSHKSEKFGKEQDWLCSNYDREKQSCRIWDFRGSSCVSFYCQSQKGPSGMGFWDALGDLLSSIEVYWSMELLRRLNFSEDLIEKQLEYLDFDGSAPEAPHLEELWGAYVGQERQLYAQIRDLNQSLSAQEKFAFMSSKLQKLEAQVLEIYKDANES